MITKRDCILLLSNLKEQGINTDKQLEEIICSDVLPLSVLKFINDTRQLDLSKFYEKIRKSYNDKHSVLYKNIVKEIDDPQEVLTTLSAMATQILLFSKKLEDKEMFLKHARLDEIYKCLYTYCKTSNIIPCINLLHLIKADIKALESLK